MAAVFVPPVELSAEEVAQVRAWVIFEDAHVIAFNKPSGLSSQGGRIRAHTLDDLLWAFARSNGKRPRLVHRLDRDTSGVILTAKTHPAASFLGKALQARRFHKRYLALVAQAPEPASGDVRAALLRAEIGRESHMRVVPDDTPEAKASHTRYRTLASSGLGALIEAEPLTGRMHQIRAHMAHLKAPLLGDARYGGPLRAGDEAVARLMLHARTLRFPHPEGGERVIEAPVPQDFVRLCEALGLEHALAGAGEGHAG
ncbi:MAG: RluA family pseudouridine synthase [Brevundimonas sp.]|uniref:RluA family pseudouridine synthase n=1 Tax=Brevundimonas sp. TaxID=1871086 RepID=UPI00391A2230